MNTATTLTDTDAATMTGEVSDMREQVQAMRTALETLLEQTQTVTTDSPPNICRSQWADVLAEVAATTGWVKVQRPIDESEAKAIRSALRREYGDSKGVTTHPAENGLVTAWVAGRRVTSDAL